MRRMMRDGMAELVSRSKLSGANGDKEIFTFPVQLTTMSRIIGSPITRLIYTLLCDEHTYVHTCILRTLLLLRF